MRRMVCAMLGAAAGLLLAANGGRAPADLILRNASVWTVDPARPAAHAVAIAGERIVAVGSEVEIARHRGARTRVIDLQGAMLLPGFTDAHTHFGNAADAFFTARVVDVDTDALLAERLRAAAARIPKGFWITASDLQAFAAAAAAKRHDATFAPFTPSLAALDAAAPDHPVLIRGHDGRAFVNSPALRLARIERGTPNPPNGEYVRDRSGALTGELRGSAAIRMAATLPPPTRARALVAARALIGTLHAQGITAIHDIARVDALSQARTPQVDVERSYTNLDLFRDLQAEGNLGIRVHAMLPLAGWRDYGRLGIRPGASEGRIHFGTLKAFMDASYMTEPFANAPDWRGGLSYRVGDPSALRADVIDADAAGFDVAIHVMGDAGHALALDAYADAISANPERDRRFRLIHMWYPSAEQVARAGAMRLFADITPSQLIEQLGSIDAALGARRAATAFPWASAAAAGMTVNIGSDWPGSFDGIAVSSNDPLENIFHAVARRRAHDTSDAAWHPNEALSVDQAIAAYTINSARAAREESERGTISPGKLADLVVLSDDIRAIPIDRIPRTRVLMTFVGGRLVYRSGS